MMPTSLIPRPSSARRMAPTRPSIMSEGATKSAPAAVGVVWVRRRRRGRRMGAVCAAVSVVGGDIVFVVIDFSVVVLNRAVLRAGAASHRFVRAVGAEAFAAYHATLQMRHFFGVGAGSAASFVDLGHVEIFPADGRLVFSSWLARL